MRRQTVALCRLSTVRHAAGILLILCLVATWASPAGAGIGEGNGEIGFDLGLTDFDSNTADDTGGLFGARGGYHFTPLFQLEGQLVGSAVDENGADVAITSLFINAVFNFHPREEIVPYVLLGLGQTNLEVEVFGFSVDDDATSYQVAAGGRFFVGSKKKLAVRVELSALREDTFDESSTHRNLAVGLTWRLGE